jgi:hypothetical protein
MEFIVKKHNTEEVYALMCSFWNMHKFPIISLDILPKNTFIAYYEDIPIYSISFYFTDSKYLAWLSWPISNKNFSYKKRTGGLSFLINHVEKYSKKKGIKMLITTTSNDSIIDVLTKCNYTVGDSGVQHMIKLI